MHSSVHAQHLFNCTHHSHVETIMMTMLKIYQLKDNDCKENELLAERTNLMNMLHPTTVATL